jgi:DNA-binding NarL/FixJ family response regulator
VVEPFSAEHAEQHENHSETVVRVTVCNSSPVFTRGLIGLIDASAGLRLVEALPSVLVDLPGRTDLFVLDVDFAADRPVIELVPRLTGTAPVLLLVRPGLDLRALRALLAAGAAGFVDNRVEPTRLVEAMRVVASGRTFRDETVHVDPSAAAELSQREQQVLELIARGLTHHQIARAIEVSRNTVDTYVKRIRFKLNLGNKAELARTAVLRSIST